MTDYKRGLTSEEVARSRERHGSNEIVTQRRVGFFRSFLSNLSDPIIRILIVAIFINIIFMFPKINWFEVGGIATSVLISTLVSTLSEFSSGNALERLKNETSSTLCRVRREGELVEIPSTEVVVGDIVVLNAGERVYADMRLIGGEVSLDESSLTGESAEVKKQIGETALRGSLVLSGYAECQIEAVGEHTYYGAVASELSQSTRPSPLKHRLSRLARSISIIGYIASALIALAYLFNVFFIDSKMVMSEVLIKLSDIRLVLSSLLNALTLAVSIIVVAVPEGLPMMITVVLCSKMKSMMSDGVVVRKLVGIETSGSLNILFTDKTGTITEGRLRPKGIYLADGSKFFSLRDMKGCEAYKKHLTLCAGYCNSAEYNGREAIGSDATDRAIRELVKNDLPRATLISKEPFDSTKKYMRVRVRIDGEQRVLVKGAPEALVDKCTTYLSKNGEMCPLKAKESVLKQLKELTSSSYRVVALATGNSESELSLIGLVAIRDKIRKDAPSAVREVTQAGVGVVMITGDNKDTAEAIAKECGIISPLTKRTLVLTSDTLSNMTDGEIAQLLPSLAVVARALPTDKSRLVRIAQG